MKVISIIELNTLVGVVGDYMHKILVISKSFRYAGDYQAFLSVNSDYLVISKCFTVLGRLYLDTKLADTVVITDDVQALLDDAMSIASRRCLVVDSDSDSESEAEDFGLFIARNVHMSACSNFKSFEMYLRDFCHDLTVIMLNKYYKALGYSNFESYCTCNFDIKGIKDNYDNYLALLR